MPNFIGNMIDDFIKIKNGFYKELGCKTTVHFFAPYKSPSEFATELGSLPIKLWTCILGTVQEALSFLCALMASTFCLVALRPIRSTDYLSNAVTHLTHTICWLISSVIDSVSVFISLFTRGIASLITRCNNADSTEGNKDAATPENSRCCCL